MAINKVRGAPCGGDNGAMSPALAPKVLPVKENKEKENNIEEVVVLDDEEEEEEEEEDDDEAMFEWALNTLRRTQYLSDSDSEEEDISEVKSSSSSAEENNSNSSVTASANKIPGDRSQSAPNVQSTVTNRIPIEASEIQRAAESSTSTIHNNALVQPCRSRQRADAPPGNVPLLQQRQAPNMQVPEASTSHQRSDELGLRQVDAIKQEELSDSEDTPQTIKQEQSDCPLCYSPVTFEEPEEDPLALPIKTESDVLPSEEQLQTPEADVLNRTVGCQQEHPVRKIEPMVETKVLEQSSIQKSNVDSSVLDLPLRNTRVVMDRQEALPNSVSTPMNIPAHMFANWDTNFGRSVPVTENSALRPSIVNLSIGSSSGPVASNVQGNTTLSNSKMTAGISGTTAVGGEKSNVSVHSHKQYNRGLGIITEHSPGQRVIGDVLPDLAVNSSRPPDTNNTSRHMSEHVISQHIGIMKDKFNSSPVTNSSGTALSAAFSFSKPHHVERPECLSQQNSDAQLQSMERHLLKVKTGLVSTSVTGTPQNLIVECNSISSGVCREKSDIIVPTNHLQSVYKIHANGGSQSIPQSNIQPSNVHNTAQTSNQHGIPAIQPNTVGNIRAPTNNQHWIPSFQPDIGGRITAQTNNPHWILCVQPNGGASITAQANYPLAVFSVPAHGDVNITAQTSTLQVIPSVQPNADTNITAQSNNLCEKSGVQPNEGINITTPTSHPQVITGVHPNGCSNIPALANYSLMIPGVQPNRSASITTQTNQPNSASSITAPANYPCMISGVQSNGSTNITTQTNDPQVISGIQSNSCSNISALANYPYMIPSFQPNGSANITTQTNNPQVISGVQPNSDSNITALVNYPYMISGVQPNGSAYIISQTSNPQVISSVQSNASSNVAALASYSFMMPTVQRNEDANITAPKTSPQEVISSVHPDGVVNITAQTSNVQVISGVHPNGVVNITAQTSNAQVISGVQPDKGSNIPAQLSYPGFVCGVQTSGSANITSQTNYPHRISGVPLHGSANITPGTNHAQNLSGSSLFSIPNAMSRNAVPSSLSTSAMTSQCATQGSLPGILGTTSDNFDYSKWVSKIAPKVFVNATQSSENSSLSSENPAVSSTLSLPQLFPNSCVRPVIAEKTDAVTSSASSSLAQQNSVPSDKRAPCVESEFNSDSDDNLTIDFDTINKACDQEDENDSANRTQIRSQAVLSECVGRTGEKALTSEKVSEPIPSDRARVPGESASTISQRFDGGKKNGINSVGEIPNEDSTVDATKPFDLTTAAIASLLHENPTIKDIEVITSSSSSGRMKSSFAPIVIFNNRTPCIMLEKCTKTHLPLTDLNTHEKRLNQVVEYGYSCTICGKQFKYKYEYANHREFHHLEEDRSEDDCRGDPDYEPEDHGKRAKVLYSLRERARKKCSPITADSDVESSWSDDSDDSKNSDDNGDSSNSKCSVDSNDSGNSSKKKQKRALRQRFDLQSRREKSVKCNMQVKLSQNYKNVSRTTNTTKINPEVIQHFQCYLCQEKLHSEKQLDSHLEHCIQIFLEKKESGQSKEVETTSISTPSPAPVLSHANKPSLALPFNGISASASLSPSTRRVDALKISHTIAKTLRQIMCRKESSDSTTTSSDSTSNMHLPNSSSPVSTTSVEADSTKALISHQRAASKGNSAKMHRSVPVTKFQAISMGNTIVRGSSDNRSYVASQPSAGSCIRTPSVTRDSTRKASKNDSTVVPADAPCNENTTRSSQNELAMTASEPLVHLSQPDGGDKPSTVSRIRQINNSSTGTPSGASTTKDPSNGSTLAATTGTSQEVISMSVMCNHIPVKKGSSHCNTNSANSKPSNHAVYSSEKPDSKMHGNAIHATSGTWQHNNIHTMPIMTSSTSYGDAVSAASDSLQIAVSSSEKSVAKRRHDGTVSAVSETLTHNSSPRMLVTTNGTSHGDTVSTTSRILNVGTSPSEGIPAKRHCGDTVSALSGTNAGMPAKTGGNSASGAFRTSEISVSNLEEPMDKHPYSNIVSATSETLQQISPLRVPVIPNGTLNCDTATRALQISGSKLEECISKHPNGDISSATSGTLQHTSTPIVPFTTHSNSHGNAVTVRTRAFQSSVSNSEEPAAKRHCVSVYSTASETLQRQKSSAEVPLSVPVMKSVLHGDIASDSSKTFSQTVSISDQPVPKTAVHCVSTSPMTRMVSPINSNSEEVVAKAAPCGDSICKTTSILHNCNSNSGNIVSRVAVCGGSISAVPDKMHHSDLNSKNPVTKAVYKASSATTATSVSDHVDSISQDTVTTVAFHSGNTISMSNKQVPADKVVNPASPSVILDDDNSITIAPNTVPIGNVQPAKDSRSLYRAFPQSPPFLLVPGTLGSSPAGMSSVMSKQCLLAESNEEKTVKHSTPRILDRCGSKKSLTASVPIRAPTRLLPENTVSSTPLTVSRTASNPGSAVSFTGKKATPADVTPELSWKLKSGATITKCTSHDKKTPMSEISHHSDHNLEPPVKVTVTPIAHSGVGTPKPGIIHSAVSDTSPSISSSLCHAPAHDRKISLKPWSTVVAGNSSARKSLTKTVSETGMAPTMSTTTAHCISNVGSVNADRTSSNAPSQTTAEMAKPVPLDLGVSHVVPSSNNPATSNLSYNALRIVNGLILKHFLVRNVLR